MATRRYSITPEQASYQVVEAVGAATVTSAIELTVDFAALAAFSPSMTGAQAKMLVQQAVEKICEYIEQRGVWPPA